MPARLTHAIAHGKAPHFYRQRDRDAVTRSRIAKVNRFDLLEHRRCSIARGLAFFHNRVGDRDNREYCAGIRGYGRVMRFLRSIVRYSLSTTIAKAAVSYTHLRAHETGRNLVCRLLLEKKK